MFRHKYHILNTIVWRGYFKRLTKNQAEELRREGYIVELVRGGILNA